MKNFFYLFLLLMLYGCEKETDIVFDYPSILVARDYKILTDVKIFTKKGQISDPSIISNYLKKDTTGLFYLIKDSYVPIKRIDTVIYQSKDTVLFSLPGEWGIRIPKKVGSYLYLYLPDTLIGYKTLQQEGDFKNITKNIGVQKPFYQEVRSSPFGSSYMRVYDAFIAKGDPSTLEFPRLTYMITRKRNSYYSWLRVKDYNNVFDPNVIKLLEEGDTLTVQEATTIFKRINP